MKQIMTFRWGIGVFLLLLLGFLLGRWSSPIRHIPATGVEMTAEQTPLVEGSASALPPDAVQAPPSGFDQQQVQSQPVSKEVAPQMLPLTGKLVFNAERSRQVSARAAGRVERILIFEGVRVTAGQILAEVYSPDFISAQNEYLLARNTVRTLQDAKSPALLEDARATLQSASNRLRVLGASDEDIAQLDQTGKVSMHQFIRSPIAGVLIKRNVDPGAYLNVGDGYATIADPSALWFYGNIYETDYSRVKIGQNLILQSPAFPGREFQGKLTYIAPSIDPATHTLAIRCEVPNPTGDLRPELFVSAQLLVGKQPVIVTPKSALIRIRDASYVIVDQGEGMYRRLPVEATSLQNNRIAITSGLKGEERVVVEGANLINELITQSKGTAS